MLTVQRMCNRGSGVWAPSFGCLLVALWVCLAPGLGFISANQPNVAACASEGISGDAKEWLISVQWLCN